MYMVEIISMTAGLGIACIGHKRTFQAGGYSLSPERTESSMGVDIYQNFFKLYA